MQRALVSAIAFLLIGTILGASADADAQRRRRRRRHQPATLIVQTTLAGAEVLIDEELVGVTPLEAPIELEPGSHTLRVRRAGYTEFTEVVEVRRGERLEVPVDLLPLSMVLTVRTDPDQARLFVDGTFRGTTPLEVELIEGEHSLRITHPTHREIIRQIRARAGQTDALDLTLEAIPESELAAPHTPQWYEDPILWAAIGGGAAAVALAIVLGVLIHNEVSSLSPLEAFCQGDDGVDVCIRVMPSWQM